MEDFSNTDRMIKIEDNIQEKLSSVMDEYTQYFGHEKMVRYVAQQSWFCMMDEYLESQGYWMKKCESSEQWADHSFKEMLSELRLKFMFPGSIPIGSKVFIPGYGVCRSLHVGWGTIGFDAGDGVMRSSDIAFPVNHQVALESDIEITEGCVVVYDKEVWLIVSIQQGASFLDTSVDLVCAEQNGEFFKNKRIKSFSLRDIAIPTFMRGPDGETTATTTLFE